MRALKVKAVIAKHLSVVGHENHDRVVKLPCFLECSRHSADLFVDEFDHCVVGSRDLLLIPDGHFGHVIPVRIVVGKTGIELLIGCLGVEFARLGLWEEACRLRCTAPKNRLVGQTGGEGRNSCN